VRHRIADGFGTAAVALTASAVVVRFFSPSWIAFRGWARVPELFSNGILVRRGTFVARQVADPFVPIDDRIHKVVRWRLLIPLLGHYLGMPAGAVLGLSHLGCVLVLVAIVRLARARGFSWFESGMLAVVVGASGWFFVSTGWLGYYDSFLVLGLLTVAYAVRRWPVWLACILTPWIDERFIIGVPLALLVRWIGTADPPSPRTLGTWLLREVLIPGALASAYVGLRFALAGRAGSQTFIEYWRSLDANIPLWRYTFGAWEGLRAGWGLVILAVFALVTRRAIFAGALLALCIAATLLAGLASADDLSRAATIVVPVVPLGWQLARKSPWWRRLYVGALLVGAALLLPAHHVVSTFTIPINDLWYESHLLLDPPPPFAPGPYLQEAQRVANQGDASRAESLANVALKLAPDAEGYNVHGVILARQGRWQEALADFDRAITLDPNLAEAWMNRARANAALGTTDAARADATRARVLAPGSPLAADAEALLRSLGG
jgi:hypothetical protein